MEQTKSIKPIPLWSSILYFGVPGAIGYWNAYMGIPLLVHLGIPLLIAFPTLLSGMGVILFGVALLAYRVDGNAWQWAALRERLRIHKLSRRELGTVLLVLLVCVVSDSVLEGTGKWLAAIPFFAPPNYFPPPFNPLLDIKFPMNDFLGAPFKGNWFIFLFWVPLSLISMIGEELLWRGYLLPRQELTHGKWAWVVNGLLWGYLFHAGMKWQFLGMWPSMLLTAWVAQRQKNTSASAIVHIGGNAILFWLFLLAGIFGIGG